MICFYVPVCQILYGKNAMVPVIYEIKSSGFLQHLQGWFEYIVHYLSNIWVVAFLSVCPSQGIRLWNLKKNRIVTDIQTESELSNWNKKVNYVVEQFLKMLQKTGTFYFINYGRHCSFSIEYPTKWHIKTNNVRKI